MGSAWSAANNADNPKNLNILFNWAAQKRHNLNHLSWAGRGLLALISLITPTGAFVVGKERKERETVKGLRTDAEGTIDVGAVGVLVGLLVGVEEEGRAVGVVVMGDREGIT